MAVHPKIQALNNYLVDPIVNKLPLTDTAFNFFISYLGNLFIQGYRIFEYLSHNHTIVLELAQQQKYKLVHYEMDIINDRTKRQEIWKQLMELVELINCNAQVHVVYLKCQKYSIMNLNELKNSRLPDTYSYPPNSSFLPVKRGYKHIDVKQEGTKLHAMIEYFLKGQSFIHNQDSFNRQITGRDGEIKFSYELHKIINTLRLIVGRQVLQNNYHVMSSQKWMRKKTRKSFKRFDLILRNENKICIIDWKFSRISAHQKINTRAFVKKNELYLQLAKKDYKSDVQLKFYCIHVDIMLDQYHKFTEAYYDYKIDEIMIDQGNKEDEDGDQQEIVFFDGQMENFVQNPALVDSNKSKNTALEDFRLRHGIEEQKSEQNNSKNEKNQDLDKPIFSHKRPQPSESQIINSHPTQESLQKVAKKKHKPDLIDTKQNNVSKIYISITQKKNKKTKGLKSPQIISIEDEDNDEQNSDDDVVFIENIPQNILPVNKNEKDPLKMNNHIRKQPPLFFDPRNLPKNAVSRYIIVTGNIQKMNKKTPTQKENQIDRKLNEQQDIEGEKQKQKINTQEQLSLQYEQINFELLDDPINETQPKLNQSIHQQIKDQQIKPNQKTQPVYRSYIVVSSGQEEGEMV